MSVYYPKQKPAPKPQGVDARVKAEAQAFADAVRSKARGVTWERVALVLLLVVALWLAFRPLGLPAPPTPPPAPAPVVGTIWTTLVHDSDHPTQEFAQLEADAGLGSGLNAMGAHLRIFDVKSKVLDDKHLRGYIDALGGPPTLIVQAEGTHKIVAIKCPATTKGVLDEVRKFKGK